MNRGTTLTVMLGLLFVLGSFAGHRAEAAYAKATNHGKPYCPKSAFLDPRKGGECWSCGNLDRTVFPVTGAKACLRKPYNRYRPARLARPTGPAFRLECASGFLLDVGAGKCYSCGDWRRSVHSVTSNKACFRTEPGRAAYRDFKKAKLKNPTGGIAKVDCSKGYKYDIGAKKCFRCAGKGWLRSEHSVTSDKACFKVVPPRAPHSVFRAASLANPGRRALKLKCGPGYRLDALAGQCYRCEDGWHRSTRGVTDANACFFRVKQRYATASYVRKFGCGSGQFFTLRNGGQCWSCPNGYFRTLGSLGGSRACTNRVGDIFAGDKSKMCRRVIAGLKSGAEGAQEIRGIAEKLIAPIRKPIEKALSELSPQVKSPKALDEMLDKVAIALGPYKFAMAEVNRFAEKVKGNPDALAKILLNPKVMCDGSPAEIRRALTSAGINLDFGRFAHRKADLWDGGLFVRSAHAATGGHQQLALNPDRIFHAVTLSNSYRAPNFVMGLTYSFSLVVGKRYIRTYFSIGPYTSAAAGGDISVGYMFFPDASIEDFEKINQLGFEIGVGQGEKLEKIIEKKREQADSVNRKNIWHYWPTGAGLNFSFDPDFLRCPRANIPGVGVSYAWGDRAGDMRKRKKRIIDLSTSLDFTIRLGKPVRLNPPEMVKEVASWGKSVTKTSWKSCR